MTSSLVEVSLNCWVLDDGTYCLSGHLYASNNSNYLDLSNPAEIQSNTRTKIPVRIVAVTEAKEDSIIFTISISPKNINDL
jgi:hypothetical protein